MDQFLHALATEQEAQARIKLSLADYQLAVRSLLPVALTDTSSGRVTARLLLSLYDGDTYPFPLPDLCGLDTPLLEHALIAIQGRAVLREEPHTLIEDGAATFQRLIELWGQS